MTRSLGLTGPPPSKTQGKGHNLGPGNSQGFYGRVSRIKFGGDSNDYKLKVLVPFLRVKSYPTATGLHPPIQGHKAPVFVLFSKMHFLCKDGHINFGGGSFDWKSEAIAPFLRVKSDWRANSHHAFSHKCI